MYIFVDESGSFAASDQPGAFSLVCGVVIPERHMRLAAEVLRRFKLNNGFQHDDEVRRKQVSEMAYFAFLAELAQTVDMIAFAVATDAAANAQAKEHQAGQVAEILHGEAGMHYPEGKAAVRHLAATIERLPVQQWIEIFCRTRLVWHIIVHASVYYVFRTPATLGSFRWVFDQKDVTKNQFDETFSDVTLPLTQSQMVEDPFPQIEGGDYSHFSHFHSDAPYPAWLPEPKHKHKGKPGNLVDARLLWTENLAFENSKTRPGLQIADLLSNGLYGLLHQRFEDNERAATLLGRLMTIPRRGNPLIGLIGIGGDTDHAVDPALARLLRQAKRSAKPLLPDHR